MDNVYLNTNVEWDYSMFYPAEIVNSSSLDDTLSLGTQQRRLDRESRWPDTTAARQHLTTWTMNVEERKSKFAQWDATTIMQILGLECK